MVEGGDNAAEQANLLVPVSNWSESIPIDHALRTAELVVAECLGGAHKSRSFL